MKRLLVLVATALLATSLVACGDASRHARSTPSTPSDARASSTATASDTSPAPLDYKVDRDRDNDLGAPSDKRDNNRVLDFGRAASASERRAIAALVKHYYAAALAGDGARGCSLLYSTIAEAAPEDDSREPGTPAYMHGDKTCAAVLTSLFKHYHPQLAAELPKLRVTRVRLKEHYGYAVLAFGALPGRATSVMREGHVWKMSQIYDEELP